VGAFFSSFLINDTSLNSGLFVFSASTCNYNFMHPDAARNERRQGLQLCHFLLSKELYPAKVVKLFMSVVTKISSK
jgi:hypothetical protein